MNKKLKLLKIEESSQNKPAITQSPDIATLLSVMDKLLHWAAIIESSDDAIISKSVDGYITSWNKGAERLYGYSTEEIIGKPVSLLMPPEKKDDFPFIMNQLHEGKRVEHYETQRLTKDGRIIHVSLTVSPIRDAKGTIIGASKIARDISDRIEMESRRDEFVSIASHELKTPITSQKAFGELMEKMIEKNGDEQYKPYIQKINHQTNKLTKLVEDLLELSRVQIGRFSIEKENFDFDSFIKDIVYNVQLTVKHTIVNKTNTGKIISGDKERLGQVLTNLLANAVKYSPNAQKVLVTSKIKGNEIHVAVKDFGIGIPKEYHEKIFGRFFRVNGQDEKTFPGMGIGLHVSSEIINHHNGKMWVESEKGKGTTIYFSLPLTQEANT